MSRDRQPVEAVDRGALGDFGESARARIAAPTVGISAADQVVTLASRHRRPGVRTSGQVGARVLRSRRGARRVRKPFARSQYSGRSCLRRWCRLRSSASASRMFSMASVSACGSPPRGRVDDQPLGEPADDLRGQVVAVAVVELRAQLRQRVHLAAVDHCVGLSRLSIAGLQEADAVIVASGGPSDPLHHHPGYNYSGTCHSSGDHLYPTHPEAEPMCGDGDLRQWRSVGGRSRRHGVPAEP